MRFYIVVVFLKMQMQLIAFLILLNIAMQQILTGEKYWSKSCPGIAICWRQHVARPCTPFLSVVQFLIHSCLLYKGLHLYEPWCQNGSEGTVYINLPLCGGWMTDSILENWFKNQFFTFASDICYLVICWSWLTFDLEHSPVCIGKLNNHHLHTTKCQPCFAASSSQLKSNGGKSYCFSRERRMQAFKKGLFPTLIKILWDSKTTSHLVNRFKWSGLWPLNRNVVSMKNCVTEVNDFADENTVAIFPGPDPLENIYSRR